MRHFFRRFLRHSKGQWAGKPFELLDWQWAEVVAPLFGWKRKDGTRRFRRGYIEVPKKNGKSTLFAGLSLYMLACDNEPGAEIYSAAVDRDQASIVYNEAANMVESSPHLSSRLSVIRSTKRIVDHRSRSFYRALSADVPAKEGLNAHAVLIDELHAQKTRDLWDTLRYAGASRRQPLHLSITTAGFDRHSICWEQHDYALKVLDGTVQDVAFFAYIAAAADEDDWTDPEVWRKANPSFGVTIDAEQFAEDCREAQESPAKENSFRRYRLNQWTEQDVRWLSMEKWDACGGEVGDLRRQRRVLRGWICRRRPTFRRWCWYFQKMMATRCCRFSGVPRKGARQRERRDRVPYGNGFEGAYIEATPGEVVDYDRIRLASTNSASGIDISQVAIDRWNATQLATQLTGDGFEMVAFGQGYASMTAPTKKLEEVVLAGRLRHGGHPVLRWMAGNVSIETGRRGQLEAVEKEELRADRRHRGADYGTGSGGQDGGHAEHLRDARKFDSVDVSLSVRVLFGEDMWDIAAKETDPKSGRMKVTRFAKTLRMTTRC